LARAPEGHAQHIAALDLLRTRTPSLPVGRGPLSDFLVAKLRQPPHELADAPHAIDDPLVGDDSTLALYVAYELHYRSFDGVDEAWEWDPSLLRLRARLECAFASRLRDELGATAADDGVESALLAMTADTRGPSLSSYMCRHGTLEQFREFAVHRSAYQLKEADPHTWAIPRLHGRAKAALVDIQTGEYGDGTPTEVHAELFADTMRALDLDAGYGAYLDRIPAPTLTTVNLMSMFGLHRRWRGALVGHLALFEMCSVVPMGRYAEALRRLGVADGARFYDAHVAADARHEVVALHDLAGALALDEPTLAPDILFGARALQLVEATFANHLIAAWSNGESSLRPA
jgi:hypothetical protein